MALARDVLLLLSLLQHTKVSSGVCVCVCVCVCTRACMRGWVRSCVCVHACVRACMYAIYIQLLYLEPLSAVCCSIPVSREVGVGIVQYSIAAYMSLELLVALCCSIPSSVELGGCLLYSM